MPCLNIYIYDLLHWLMSIPYLVLPECLLVITPETTRVSNMAAHFNLDFLRKGEGGALSCDCQPIPGGTEGAGKGKWRLASHRPLMRFMNQWVVSVSMRLDLKNNVRPASTGGMEMGGWGVGVHANKLFYSYKYHSHVHSVAHNLILTCSFTGNAWAWGQSK